MSTAQNIALQFVVIDVPTTNNNKKQQVPNTDVLEDELEDFRQEVASMASMHHPRIALFLGAYLPELGSKESIHIVMELLNGYTRLLMPNVCLYYLTRPCGCACVCLVWLGTWRRCWWLIAT